MERVAFDEATRRAERTACQITREVLERLADDIVASACDSGMRRRPGSQARSPCDGLLRATGPFASRTPRMLGRCGHGHDRRTGRHTRNRNARS